LARAHVQQILAEWGLKESVPAAEKLVVELVNNAVLHATRPGGGVAAIGAGAAPSLPKNVVAGIGSDLALVLKKGSGSLWIEVHDDDPRLPVSPALRTRAGSEETSGLQRVDSLASRWGSRRTHAGKVVWCEIVIDSLEAR
jgi:hypothetical protein